MFQTLRNAWKIEDLRKKLLFTLLILVIVRLGCAIPVPFLDPSRLQEMLDSTQGNLLGYLNLLTGGAFAEATLFALGVSPYITASIVIQLLTVAIPSLERMAKEGPDGQKKLKKITRYSTIGLAVLQAYAYYTLLRSSQFNAVKYTSGAAGWISGIAIVLAFSAGAMLVVWLGVYLPDPVRRHCGADPQPHHPFDRLHQAGRILPQILCAGSAGCDPLHCDDCFHRTDERRRAPYSRTVCQAYRGS